ncbi:B12-binding domain-containing radical SAM protein, partial [Patescibacteria group bacterium]|nr:B12-binding domain-containing radical SAM protein [Patescibacteria group bacterium]
VVPAQAATMLKNKGFEVAWLDGIAEKKSFEKWLEEVKQEKADLLFLETKTPVVKVHWKIISIIKKTRPDLKVVLVGDHVTALPKESFEKSKVDFVLTGGDYDFLLLNLAQHLTRGEKLEPGIWQRGRSGKPFSSGKFKQNHSLDEIPFIDRDLTKWELYAYKNGNYKKTPGTYIMAGRDCWWRYKGGCKFCAWTVLYPEYKTRSVENVLDEIGELIEKYEIREVMDDAGTFSAGKYLQDFCKGMIERGYNKKINFDCNVRFGILKREDYELMAKAGFRFLLYGLESANQKTVDKLNKGIKISKIEKELEVLNKANKQVSGHLQPHVTCMVGYPWETKKDAEKTISMTKNLFAKGLIDTLQATVVIAYPGTSLFKLCKKNNWLKSTDWNKYDMRQPIMKTPMKDKEVMELTQGIYKSFMTPKFILRKVLSIRDLDDLKFFARAGKAVFGHLTDFKKI